MQTTTTRNQRSAGQIFRVLALFAAMLLILTVAACGGGSADGLLGDMPDLGIQASDELADEFSVDELADEVRTASAVVPRNLLPAPSSLRKKLSSSPQAVCPGSGFESNLPHHRVFSRGDAAVFRPQSSRGWSWGRSNGRYAYALYHLTAPEGTSTSEDVTVKLRLSPLYQGGGLSGESPLYVGLANWDQDSWTFKAQDYNSSRSNTTTAIDLGDFIDDDDDDDSIPESYLLAVACGPGSRYGGGGGGGVLVLRQLSVSGGWSLSVVDSGLRSSSIPSGLRELDAERCEDGSHRLAYFASGFSLRHARCVDGSCTTSRIPQTFRCGPNVSLACDSSSLPHVASWRSSSDTGPLKWMAPEGLWHHSSFYDGDSSGPPFDPAVCPSIVVDSEGTQHIVYASPDEGWPIYVRKRPGRSPEQEVITTSLRIRKRPDLLLSEWDSLVCVFRTEGSGGAVFVYERGAAGWEGEQVAEMPCPVNPDGTSSGYLCADLNQDGRLDIVCNSPEGDFVVHRDLATRKTQVDQISSSSSGEACSVSSFGPFAHVFIYDPTSSSVRYMRKAAWGDVDREEMCARIAIGEAGVKEHVKTLEVVVDPDDDGDGVGEASCYLMLLDPSSSSSSRGLSHWTLEVRVNRIEMA